MPRNTAFSIKERLNPLFIPAQQINLFDQYLNSKNLGEIEKTPYSIVSKRAEN
jgi:hypothetical protein